MPALKVFGILLILTELAGLAFGIYALLRGGRGQQGGIGPIPERGVHLIAGARMLLVGALSLAAGIYLLPSFSSISAFACASPGQPAVEQAC